MINGFTLLASLFLFFYESAPFNLEALCVFTYLIISTTLALYLDQKLSMKHTKEKIAITDSQGKKYFKYNYTFDAAKA